MKRDNIYRKRLDKHMDELKWLYMELYNSQDMFDGLLKGMEGFYKERAGGLRALDAAREEDPDVYKRQADVRASYLRGGDSPGIPVQQAHTRGGV